jgi:hypothetical protein
VSQKVYAMSRKERFCIFCGNPPLDKNKEHVLPQWLIDLTGLTKRVVNFGMDPITGKVPRFDWSSFVFPSCRSCNESYSILEAEAKLLIERLIARDPIKASDYILLLDWLDKVRVGLWLGYSYLHKNPLQISPTFHIDSRIGQKDRMLAIYTVDTHRKGLNTYGAETLCFQYQPSCFSLNINNIYVLNMSWDFMCSARCGFPFPRNAVIDLDNTGMLECSALLINHKVKHPIFRKRLVKPSIHLYEPIIQINDFPDDEWLKRRLIPGSNSKGVIYRQWDDRVQVIDELHTLIENGEVKGHDCRPLAEIIAQTYELQLESCAAYKYHSVDKANMTAAKARNTLFQKQNKMYKKAFIDLLKRREQE